MRFGLVLSFLLFFSFASSARPLDALEWSKRMRLVPNLSLRTLLAQRLIKRTSVDRVFELDFVGGEPDLKERLAVQVLAQSLNRPILLTPKLPGLGNTPMVDAIVFDEEGQFPEFNLSLKSIVSPNSNRKSSERIRVARQVLERRYSSEGLFQIATGNNHYGDVRDHLNAARRLLGLTKSNRRPIAISLDYLFNEYATPSFYRDSAKDDESNIFISTGSEGRNDWEGLSLTRLEGYIKAKEWAYFFFIFKSKLVIVDDARLGYERYRRPINLRSNPS